MTVIASTRPIAEVTSLLRGPHDEPAVCGRGEDGIVTCWSARDAPFLRTDKPEILDVVGLDRIKDVVQIAGEGETYETTQVCALTRAGEVYCWGGGARAPLPRPDVQRIPGLPPATRIAVAERHACALAGMGEVYCWGSNAGGAVGAGTPGVVRAPARVRFLSAAVP
jgi:hypothetical protein